MNYNGHQTFDKYGHLINNMLGEEWASWPKDEEISKYQVSTAGRVRRIIGAGWQIINPIIMRDGSVTVRLNVGGKQKTLALKKLVAEVWVKNIFSAPNVLIINDNPSDLRSCNLAWYDLTELRKEKTKVREFLHAKIKMMDLESLRKLYEVADHF